MQSFFKLFWRTCFSFHDFLPLLSILPIRKGINSILL
jgi:hypothetical protein